MHDALPRISALLQERAWLESLATRLVGNDDAEDLVQDTWRAVLEGPPVRTRARAGLRAWLRVVATRRSVERWREEQSRRARETEISRATQHRTEVEAVSNPSAELQRAELRRFLAEAVLALDEPLRDVVVLRYFEAQSYGAIARRLEISEPLARKRASRAVAELRMKLDEHAGGDRTVWTAALTPFVARSRAAIHEPPMHASVNFALAGGAVHVVVFTALAVLIGFSVWRGPGEGDEGNRRYDPLARAGLDGPGELDGSERKGLSKVANSSKRTRVGAKEGAVDEVGRAARPAFPMPPNRDLATLHLLAVWDDTGDAAPDQLLRSWNHTFRTDASGRATLMRLRPGPRGISNGAGSHLNCTLPPGEVTELTFRIERQYHVSGRVVDASGAPVAEADVLVGHSANRAELPLARTGSDGRFRIHGFSKTVVLSASKSGVGLSEAILLTGDGERSRKVELTLADGTGSIAGTVVDDEGYAVSGACIRFESHRGGNQQVPVRPLTDGKSDDDGAFRLDGLRVGPGILYVTTALHVESATLLQVTKGATEQVDVRLERGVDVSGVVVSGPDGSPVPRVLVLLGTAADPRASAAMTEANGGFVLDRVPVDATKLRVELWAQTLHERSIDLTGGRAHEFEIHVERPSQRVDGFVSLEDGRRLEGCEVVAEAVGERSYVSRTDSRGAFRIEHAPRASSMITVSMTSDSGHRMLAMRSIELPCEPPVDIVVPSDRWATGGLRGRVVDAGNAPIGDFEVELLSADGLSEAYAHGQVSGRFRFSDVPAGWHELVLRSPERVTEVHRVEVIADEVTTLEAIRMLDGAYFVLDLEFQPPLEDRESVDIYERRAVPGRGATPIALGAVEGGVNRLGPVAPGTTSLILRGNGVNEEFALDVEPGGSSHHSRRVFRWAPTPVVIRRASSSDPRQASSALDADRSPIEWSLRDARGRVVQDSVRADRFRVLRPLILHGLELGEPFTLDVNDLSGRRGSASVIGGSPGTIVIR